MIVLNFCVRQVWTLLKFVYTSMWLTYLSSLMRYVSLVQPDGARNVLHMLEGARREQAISEN